METIGSLSEADSAQNSIIDVRPNTCPVCHFKISPTERGGFFNRLLGINNPDEELQVIYRCSNKECMSLFIGYYKRIGSSTSFALTLLKPKKIQERVFSEIITSISSEFSKIYNEASHAEEVGLSNICGAGYRKALEYLIKDYLLSKNTETEQIEIIKAEFLGKSIEDRITDINIKTVAKRAAWLGNDETHYIRKWDQKDLKDLKKLIDLTIHWMESEKLTSDILTEMPS